jgi:hypothetical protein
MGYRALTFALSGLFLAACSGPEAGAPGFSVQALPVSTKYATLVVYRQKSSPLSSVATVMSSDRRVALLANGAEAMTLHAEAFTLILVKPGHLHLESKWGFDLLLAPTGYADLDVQASKVYYFQVVPDDEPEPSPDAQQVPNAPATTWLVDGTKVWVTGKWLMPEAADLAVGELQYCCRYMPVDEDYSPAEYTDPND